MWFDTTVELPKKEHDFVGKKCFRCGAPAVKVTVVGETSRYNTGAVYAYVCAESPDCPFRKTSTPSS